MKRRPLHLWILLAMALGGALGVGLNLAGARGLLPVTTVLGVAAVGEWLGKVFLALLSMVVVPLVFSSLVSSVLEVGRSGDLGRLGLRTLGYYMLTSAAAIGTGVALVNLIRPGEGLAYEQLAAAARGSAGAATFELPAREGGALQVLVDVFYRMIPSNVVSAASSNTSILAVIFFAVLFGVFAARVGGEPADLVSRASRAVFEIMTAMVHAILYLAPVGIFGYVLFVTAATGLELAGGLAWYMLTVALGLLIHAGVTLPALLWLITGRSPLAYARSMADALLTAFSTASSSGTLPVTLRCVGDAGVPPRVASFTLSLGSTVNMDGTALYEAVAVLFVAQMLGGLDLGQQIVVALTALLASIGAAGIPHAGTVMMVIVLGAVGLPTDAVLVILAVDRVLDMMRTTVNVWSDMVGAAVVTRLEGAPPAAAAGPAGAGGPPGASGPR